MQWDDLRVFLSIAREGSLAGAARHLGVTHSTVFRRLNTFEDGLGVRLFERSANGYMLTVAGEEMRASAERVEHEIDRLDRRITGQDLRLEGTLIVTTTDTLATELLGPHFAAFKAAYPGIDVELMLDVQYVNMSKRQADVAIRPTLDPPETLVGRRICDIAFAPYVSDAYLNNRADDSTDIAWIVVDDSLTHLASAKWLRKTHPDATVALRSNSLLGLQVAAEAGIGAAVLPCFMGDRSAQLNRLREPVDGAGSALWLLTHEDLRLTARVRAFMNFMADALKADIGLLEGRGKVD